MHHGPADEGTRPVDRRSPVVVAKLRRPRLRPGELRRDRLVTFLSAAAVPVVAVRAPAGYGKTTTVRQWVEEDARPAAWVSLDAADNDPIRFLRHVVRAIDGVTALPDVEGLLAVEPPRVTAILPALATALSERPPMVLVLDDVHVVTEASVAALLEWLIGALPPESTLALVGRSAPPVRVTRHVAADDAVLLRREDLAFTRPELRSVVAGALPDLDAATVAGLYERTEGWPAGLQLSILAARAAPDPSAVLADLPRHAVDLGAYVHEELLRHLDSRLRTFLVRTAVLDRLSPALCDAVLGRDDSGAVLRSLAESENLFVVAHDDDPEWLRYHHLFADLLLAELRAQTPALEPVLRERAARWLSAHGDPDGAVGQALAAGDWELAATLAHVHAHDLVQRGQITTIARWLDRFPAEQTRGSALLMLLHGWVDLVEGRPDDVARRLRLLDECHWEGPLPDGTPTLAVARASLAMLHAGGGVKQTAADARVVRDAGPAANPWWSTAWLFEAQSTVLADGGADAVALFGDAELAARGDTSTHLVCLAHLGWARLRAGDVAGGLAAADDAYRGLAAHRLEDYNLAVFVHAVHAYVSAHRGRRGDAQASSAQAERLLSTVGGGIPRAQVQTRLVLAEAALLLDDGEAAAALVTAAEPFLELEPDALVLWEWVDGLRERLSARRRRAGLVERHRLTEAELRVLAQLPTHRSLEAIGRELYISRNTVKTHAVSIYRKLGVSGRGAAVDRARALGLLAVAPTERR